MIRRLLPVVVVVAASSCYIGAASSVEVDTNNNGGIGNIDNIGIASTVQLAHETIGRFVLPPTAASSDETSSSSSISSSTTNNGSSSSAADADTTNDVSDDKTTTTTTTTEDKNIAYDGSDLIEWINGNKGMIHPNARIGLDPTGQYRGVFVKDSGEGEHGGGTSEGIEDGDIIARIPWDLIVKPKNYSDNTFWSCEALREMHRQFILGDQSKFAPYINYLKNQPRGRIPSEWTPSGKSLLSTILDQSETDPLSEDVGLPPRLFSKSFEDTWMGECGGEDTELARAAFYQFTSRDEDTLMVPFYDMHNHSNDPKRLNTISHKPEGPGKPFVLRAMRDIAPGEQILISYNRCNPCWFDKGYTDCESYSHYGTSQLFDIFGFVEDFPQRWQYRMIIEEDGEEVVDDLLLCINKSEEGDLMVMFGDNYSRNPEGERPVENNIKWMGGELKRLKELEETMKKDGEVMETMPGYEWDMAWRYHEALMTSMSAAILASDFAGNADVDGDSEDEEESEVVSEDDGSDDEEGSEVGSEDNGSEDEEGSEDSVEEDDSSDDSGDDNEEEGRDEL